MLNAILNFEIKSVIIDYTANDSKVTGAYVRGYRFYYI